MPDVITSPNPATDETLARVPPHGGADIEHRLEAAHRAQSGWARTIVEETVDEAFVEATRRLVVGDPLHAASTQGSMARRNLRDELQAQIRASVREGARLMTGGNPIAGPGVFHEPTMLDHVTPDRTVTRDVPFGPAAAILRVRNVHEAVRVANRTPFGLGATVWTGQARI